MGTRAASAADCSEPSPIESVPGRRRKPESRARRVDREVRTPKLGSQLRFDLSKDALRGRRSETDLAR